jgi:hypothetical protein
MLNYVGGLFTDMGKAEIQPVIFWHTDFRTLQIYVIVAVGAVLTGWSLCFVLVFRWRISCHSDFSDQRPYPSNRKSRGPVVIDQNDSRQGCAKALTLDRKLSYFGDLTRHGTASGAPRCKLLSLSRLGY